MVFFLNVFALIAYYASALFFFALAVPLHEFGHFLFGRLTGYRFVSFTLFSFTIKREDGKLHFYKANKGDPGQCVMYPPEDESRYHYVLYNLGGGLMNLLLAALLLAGHLSSSADSVTYNTVLLVGCFMNAFLGLYHIIPLNLSGPNDGLNVLTAMKSPEAKHGLYVILHFNEKSTQGMRYRDFGPTLFSVSDTADLKNYLVANLVIYEASRLYDLGDYTGSLTTLKRLDPDRLPAYYGNAIRADLIYHYIIHEPDDAKARALCMVKGMGKFLKAGFPSANRIFTAIVFFLENNREGGRRMLKKTREYNKAYPNKGIRRMELDYLKVLEATMDKAEVEQKDDIAEGIADTVAGGTSPANETAGDIPDAVIIESEPGR